MAIEDRQLGAGGVLALVETQRENERLRAKIGALVSVVTAVTDGLIETLTPGPDRHVIELAVQQLKTAANEARLP